MLVIAIAAAGEVNNFPVKSKGTLPAVSYYTAHTGYQVELEDAHAVVATATADGGVVVAGKAVECGDACTTAEAKWTYTTDGTIYSSPAIGANGHVYVGARDDKLHAVDPLALLECGDACAPAHAPPQRPS